MAIPLLACAKVKDALRLLIIIRHSPNRKRILVLHPCRNASSIADRIGSEMQHQHSAVRDVNVQYRYMYCI